MKNPTIDQAYLALVQAESKLWAMLADCPESKLAVELYRLLEVPKRYLNRRCLNHGCLLETESRICPACELDLREADARSYQSCARCGGSGEILVSTVAEKGSGEWLKERPCPDCQR